MTIGEGWIPAPINAEPDDFRGYDKKQAEKTKYRDLFNYDSAVHGGMIGTIVGVVPRLSESP